jgi:glyoxylase-like metal-dependent hydrolase (beta-lactamase superfamily II)
MRRFVRVSIVVVLVLAAAAYGAFRYFTARTAVPETSAYELDFAEMRRLASSIPGEKPVRVHHQPVAEGALPRGAVFAGESLTTPLPNVHGAYEVVYADGGFGVIDSAFDRKAFEKMNPGGLYSAAGYEKVQSALADAKWIVITHEHADHIGGIARFADPKRLVGRLQLTREQLGNDEALEFVEFPQSLRSALEPLAYERYHAIAPGVVLVKAPGHTAGTQMIFVQQADGKELLFLGDVAWHMDQIRKLWYRPRLVTDLYIGEDREQVLDQFRTLHDLADREPGVTLVSSHDRNQRRELVEKSVIGDGFPLPPPELMDYGVID